MISNLTATFSHAHLAGDLPLTERAGTFALVFVEPPEDMREIAADEG